MTNSPITILGGGIAGFGAAHRLSEEGIRATLYDKNPYPGGNTASFQHAGGFVFDEGCHISFTSNDRVKEIFARNVDGNFEVIKASVNNYWRSHWIKHPAACNLYGLPTDLVVKILSDFVAANSSPESPIGNYADWLRATYGPAFAETFPMEYTRKYHTTGAENLTTTWLGPRLYRPKLEEVFRGALTPETPDVHYVSLFRYPRCNGFVSYLKPFFAEAEVRLGRRVTGIVPSTKRLLFSDGTEDHYEQLISSLPLPELVPMIEGAPPEVVEAARRLACSTSVIVNLGVNREDLSGAHWTYFYDQDICITRVNFPHMLSPNNAPAGCGSIQAEVYFSEKYRPLDSAPEEWIAPVIRDLKKCGVLRPEDKILFQEARVIRYANIIFDHERDASLALIRGYLDEIGLATCGRYGLWGYLWTDQSFLSGEKAAEKILDRSSQSDRLLQEVSAG